MKLLNRKVRKKMSCILKPMKEVEEYALPQKKEYYTSLKNICNHFKGVSISCLNSFLKFPCEGES